MPVRARYSGGFANGVELAVPLADGTTHPIHVPRGGLLPDEIDGQSVPASFRGALLEQDDWTTQRQSSEKGGDR